MTRILSNILQAAEPHFRLQLSQLERISGHEKVDIKLSVEVVQTAKQKIHSLGLDKHDTTAEELYQALLQRVSDDDARLERALRTRAAINVNAESHLMDGMLHALQAEAKDVSSFRIKSAVLKRLLKKTPPKRLLKSLGYRSLDAMIRNESASMLVAAAVAFETTAWRRSWTESYKQLNAADFDSVTTQVMAADGSRWRRVAEKLVQNKAHTVVSAPEVGTIVLLPLPAERPQGMVIATMALALHELNVVAAASNYLRASQVHGDFAKRVQTAATGRVQLTPAHMSQSMPWHLVQRYFATTKAAVNEDVFGPYVQSTDFHWHDIEERLTTLCAPLAFWEGSRHVTFLHEGKAVSMNVLDAAISACNQLAFDARSRSHAQQALWSELALRYLNHDSLERAVASVLHPQLALEPATNE